MIDSLKNLTTINKIDLLKQTDKPKIGYISYYIPEEIFHAAGMIPFRITGEFQYSSAEACGFLHRNMCSYILSCLNEGASDIYNFMDGIIMNNICDAQTRLFDVWNNYFQPSYSFYLHYPRQFNQASIDFFRNQINELIESTKRQSGFEITNNSLIDAINLCNESRILLQKLYNQRKANKGINLTSKEIIKIVNYSMCGFKEDFNRHLDSILLQRNHEEQLQCNKKRILICSNFFENFKLIDMIEKFGGEVVCEYDFLKYFDEQIDSYSDPVDAISDFYFKRALGRFLDNFESRIGDLFRVIDEYNIELVVFFSLKFCENSLMDFPEIKKKLLKNNIPVLFIEGERHMSNMEHIKTRIQTFMEIHYCPK